MAKRIIGLVLALCLIVGLLPMIALAEDPAPVTAEVIFNTGTESTNPAWTPALSAGMTPVYAKTTDEGLTTEEGASATDWNIMVEWPIDGKPTVTLKNAKLVNNILKVAPTIRLDGTADFVIQLKGRNTIDDNLASTTTTAANGARAQAIYAYNTGTLTIRGENKTTDSLHIDQKGAHCIVKRYNALTIENATITAKLWNTATKLQIVILTMSMDTDHEDLTNVTVRNSVLDFDLGTFYANKAVVMSQKSESVSSANKGDILFENSILEFTRDSSDNPKTNAGTEVVSFEVNSTLTFDRCDALIYGYHRTVRKVPAITNYNTVTIKNDLGEDVSFDAFEPKADIEGGTGTFSRIEIKHTCAAAAADGKLDCTVPNNCVVCGTAIGTVQNAHNWDTEDGDCTTAVKCKNTGCEQIKVAAKDAHAFTDASDTTCNNDGCVYSLTSKPNFTFSYATKGGDADASFVMKAGDATKYFTTGQYDTENPNNWYMKETTDSTNWNVKIEYAADGIPTVTLKGAKIANKSAMLFGGAAEAYEGPTKVIVEADSFVCNVMAYNSKNPQTSALNFNTKGDNDDVTITSVNNAKLTIATNCYDITRGGISTTGNLILDNANIVIATSEYNSTSNGITVIGGNLIVKGGNLKISGYDDLKTTHSPDSDSDHRRNVNAVYSGLYVTKDPDNAAKAGNITIQDGAKVSIAVSVKGKDKTDTVPYENKSMAIYNQGIFTIKESDVEIGLVGKIASDAQLFEVKPTLEYANNAYTVTATKSKKPDVNVTVLEEANDSTYLVDMIPDTSKIVDWAKTSELWSITYFQVARGGNGGNGTGTGGSNPNTGDISILLTAAVALSSAVGFAGVTVLRKKEH